MDDDVTIEDEGGPEIQKTPLGNQDLSFLQQTVGPLVAEYGWYLLFMCVGVYLVVQHLSKRRASQGQSSSASGAVQDPNAVVRRQEALEASRRRMQEELDAKAALFRLKQQQLEEEKRQQKIEMYDSMKEGRSYRGKAKTAQNTEEASTSTTVLKPKTDKKPLRSSGFNPLSGEGGGSCVWRPGRRGPSAGGG
ncbi:selenoprotein S-like [Salvelinus namaycush]|uniref:Selenoprotein S-like n=1 Tax=Salvelinus namaycush TaxID=8040 RepID=A0A8U0UGJ2_SALNM|nr:selenoprotein S-like [Salvelinus namaycush]XP_038851996.1 selenoprotein S-like [Salvelinus namaycush]